MFRPRTVLAVLAIALSVFALLELIWLARQVISWILIALFFALALNPAVEALQRRGIRRRGVAVGTTYLVVLLLIAVLGATSAARRHSRCSAKPSREAGGGNRTRITSLEG